MAKVIGWMLREVWTHGSEIELLDEFLAENVQGMSATMLSYTIEKMSPEHKQYWRNLRIKSVTK